MAQPDKQDLIVNIFKAEAKNGKSELRIMELTDHPLNKTRGFLSVISRGVFQTSRKVITSDAEMYAHLDNMKKLGVVSSRIEQVEISDQKFYKKLYRLTGTPLPRNASAKTNIELTPAVA